MTRKITPLTLGATVVLPAGNAVGEHVPVAQATPLAVDAAVGRKSRGDVEAL